MKGDSASLINSILSLDSARQRPVCKKGVSRLCKGSCVPISKDCLEEKAGQFREGKTRRFAFKNKKGFSSVEISKVLAKEENSIRNRSVEHLIIVNPDNGEVYRKVGEQTSISFTEEEIEGVEGNIVSHNHPNLGWKGDDARSKGIGFSFEDLDFASTYNAREIRAVTNSYNFSMKPPSEGWNNNRLRKAYSKAEREVTQSMVLSFITGKTSIEEMEANFHHEVASSVAKRIGAKYRRELV